MSARDKSNISVHGPLPMLIGAEALLQGFRLIWRPGLRRYSLAPLAVNVVLVIGLLWIAGQGIDAALDWLWVGLPWWLAWLEWLLWLLLLMLVLLLLCYLFTALATLLGAPFTGALAARVELELTGVCPEVDRGVWQEAMISIVGELRKLWFIGQRAAVLALVSLVLLFLPPLNALIPMLWLIFGAYMLALEYLDLPLDNHGYDFAAKLAVLRRHRGHSLGFGAAATLATAIPVLNLFVMPAAVAGATALWVEHMAEGKMDSEAITAENG